MRSNGRLVRVNPDGSEEGLETPSLVPRSAADIEAAAAGDRENPPLTEARRGRLQPVPRVKTLRRALALTQEEFAVRYHIPLGTLRDWEQGRSEPDQPAKASAPLSLAIPRESSGRCILSYIVRVSLVEFRIDGGGRKKCGGSGPQTKEAQNCLGMPACFKTPLAVWRDRILWSTGKYRWEIGLYQIS